MRTLRNLLKEKGSQVWSIDPEALVFDAILRMDEAGVGALLVLENDRLVGIVSERDYTRKIAIKQRSSKHTQVVEIMSHPAICISIGASVEECMALMTERHVRHLPVLDNDQLAGVVSLGDVVKAVIEDKGILIEQLERYIAGR